MLIDKLACVGDQEVIQLILVEILVVVLESHVDQANGFILGGYCVCPPFVEQLAERHWSINLIVSSDIVTLLDAVHRVGAVGV